MYKFRNEPIVDALTYSNSHRVFNYFSDTTAFGMDSWIKTSNWRSPYDFFFVKFILRKQLCYHNCCNGGFASAFKHGNAAI